MNLFFFSRSGERVEGPVPADQLYHMVRAGQLNQAAMVRPAGKEDTLENWTSFDTLPAEVFSLKVQKALRDQEEAGKAADKAGRGCGILIWIVFLAICALFGAWIGQIFF